MPQTMAFKTESHLGSVLPISFWAHKIAKASENSLAYFSLKNFFFLTMVATRQKTGHSKPKIWRDDDYEKTLPIKNGFTRAKAMPAKKLQDVKKMSQRKAPPAIGSESSFSSTHAVVHHMKWGKELTSKSQPLSLQAVVPNANLEGEIKKIASRIWKLTKDVRPFVMKQQEHKGVLIMRQDYGCVKLEEMGPDIALTVMPTLKVLSCPLSTGIPKLFPTKAVLRVKHACCDDSTATKKMFLPNFKSMLDVVNSMFCGDYKDEMLRQLQQHMSNVEGELSTMKTWVEEPRKILALLQRHTGVKAPVECAHQVGAITCSECLHDLSRHWRVKNSSYRFECPDRFLKKRDWDDRTLCGNEHTIHEFLFMDRRLAFIDHPVLDESIVMMRRNANDLHFLAPGHTFDVNSREGHVGFEEVVKLFKNTKLHPYVSDHHEIQSSDEEEANRL